MELTKDEKSTLRFTLLELRRYRGQLSVKQYHLLDRVRRSMSWGVRAELRQKEGELDAVKLKAGSDTIRHFLSENNFSMRAHNALSRPQLVDKPIAYLVALAEEYKLTSLHNVGAKTADEILRALQKNGRISVINKVRTK